MTIWFSSDPHFGHRNMVEKFVTADGKPARPFATVEEMDEFIVEQHNKHVKPSDHWYCLGDVAMRAEHLPIVKRLNGHKRLVRGNHDIFKTKIYLQYFEEIHGCRVLDNLLFTHIPVAPWSLARFDANVHGHVHHNEPLVYRVAHPRGGQGFDRAGVYVNVSVERTNYRPVTLEEIRLWLGKS